MASQSPQSQSPGSLIPRGVSFSNLKFEKLSEILIQIENILTYWSVAQIRVMKKTECRKISLDYPYKLIVRDDLGRLKPVTVMRTEQELNWLPALPPLYILM